MADRPSSDLHSGDRDLEGEVAPDESLAAADESPSIPRHALRKHDEPVAGNDDTSERAIVASRESEE